MINRLIILVTLAITCSCNSQKKIGKTASEKLNPLQYVNPNIGTAHSRWFFYTPAAVPFGMAKLGPTTNGSYGNVHGWDAVGYDVRQNSIEGFANLHEFQVGGFLFAAMTGNLKTIPGKLENPDEGYRSRFDKKDEIAQPGYYKVLLKDYNIKAELTATKRVGFHRYSFPKTDSSYVLFDVGNELGESGVVKDAYVNYNPKDNTIEGWAITYPKYVQTYQPDGDIKMYFSGVLSRKPTAMGTFQKEVQFPGETSRKGKGVGVYLRYDTREESAVEIKAGFSYTSMDNAKENLEAEAKTLTFDKAKAQAQKTWSEELNKIQVQGSSTENKVKFYTGLFHALLGRGLASDVDGHFPQNDGTIGQIPLDKAGKPTFSFYNTDSVWGAFWNLTQLWTLVWPEYYNDFVQTHLAVYKNSGWLGDGLANSKFVSGVGTNFVGLIIASAYQAGIRNYDVDLAFKAAYENEVKYEGRNPGAGKLDLGTFIKNGYVTQTKGMTTKPEGSGFSASHTLEYCYSSYAVAQFAKSLGKEKEYKELMLLSQNWKNLYDKKTNFIRPKNASGNFLDHFDPFQPWVGFQEGNAWQYTFYVPHDPKALIAEMGQEVFVKRLDSIFTISKKTAFGGKDIDAFAGVKYMYNHGNQPNLHIAYLFNYTDHPWLSQKWIRIIDDKFYGTEEIHGYGYGQDEDQGQLGSWFVMSAMGLFDVKGLTDIKPSFQITSPLFDSMKIKTGWGNTINISTANNAPENYYIQSLKINGKEYRNRSIPLETLRKDCTFDFNLGPNPKKDWFSNEIPK